METLTFCSVREVNSSILFKKNSIPEHSKWVFCLSYKVNSLRFCNTICVIGSTSNRDRSILDHVLIIWIGWMYPKTTWNEDDSWKNNNSKQKNSRPDEEKKTSESKINSNLAWASSSFRKYMSTDQHGNEKKRNTKKNKKQLTFDLFCHDFLWFVPVSPITRALAQLNKLETWIKWSRPLPENLAC